MPNASIALEIDATTEERVQRLASAQKVTTQAILRAALYQYVEREEKRESIKELAQRAWSKHRSTGLHLTDKEADAWLAQLEAGDDVPLPACHV